MSREQSKRTIPCPPKCLVRRRAVIGMGISTADYTGGSCFCTTVEYNR
jgi:hypothetical protein